MIAVILFCFSMVAFGQFGLYYWRVSIANTAAKQVSDRVRVAAGISAGGSSLDFRAILRVRGLTSDLRGPGRTYCAIRVYYLMVEKIGSLIPPVSDWAEAEMNMCSRYIAVLVDQHFERDEECAIPMRGI